MRPFKLVILSAALPLLALAAPAQACVRGCQEPVARICAWTEPCGARRLEASLNPVAWQSRALQAYNRTLTRVDVEGIRLLQRMP